MFTPKVTTLPLLGHKKLRFGVLEAYLNMEWPTFFSFAELDMLLRCTRQQFGLPTEQDMERLLQKIVDDTTIATNHTEFRSRVMTRNVDCIGVSMQGTPTTGIMVEYGVLRTKRPVQNLHEALDLLKVWTLNRGLNELTAYSIFREFVSMELLPCPPQELAKLLGQRQIEHGVERVASTLRNLRNFWKDLTDE